MSILSSRGAWPDPTRRHRVTARVRESYRRGGAPIPRTADSLRAAATANLSRQLSRALSHPVSTVIVSVRYHTISAVCRLTGWKKSMDGIVAAAMTHRDEPQGRRRHRASGDWHG